MKRKTLKAILMIAALMAATSAQADNYLYDHNGSTMRVNVEGTAVRIYYQQPRSGLQGVGVRSGTLLFDGEVNSGYLEGKSRVFNAKCGDVDYFVYGDFQPGRNFKLAGAAPVLSNMSCRIVDNTYEGSNANLLFTALGNRVPASNQSAQTTASGCVKGVNTYLNIRVGPGSNYGQIGQLPAGSCGIQVRERCQDNWCLVQQGQTVGWASMRYIQR